MLGVLERSPNLHLSDAIKSGLANQVGPALRCAKRKGNNIHTQTTRSGLNFGTEAIVGYIILYISFEPTRSGLNFGK